MNITADKPNDEACGRRYRGEYGVVAAKLGISNIIKFKATHNERKARLKGQGQVRRPARATTERGEKSEPRDNICSGISSLHQTFNGHRNNFLYYCQHSGSESASEYNIRMSRIIDTFEWVDPDELFPEDRHLVDSHSPETLATVTSDARIAWEESIQTAFAAVEHTHIKRTMERIGCVDYSMLQASHFCPNPRNQRAPTVKRNKRWVRATISLSQLWLILSVYWQKWSYCLYNRYGPGRCSAYCGKESPR